MTLALNLLPEASNMKPCFSIQLTKGNSVYWFSTSQRKPWIFIHYSADQRNYCLAGGNPVLVFNIYPKETLPGRRKPCIGIYTKYIQRKHCLAGGNSALVFN